MANVFVQEDCIGRGYYENAWPSNKRSHPQQRTPVLDIGFFVQIGMIPPTSLLRQPLASGRLLASFCTCAFFGKSISMNSFILLLHLPNDFRDTSGCYLLRMIFNIMIVSLGPLVCPDPIHKHTIYSGYPVVLVWSDHLVLVV